MFGFGAPEFIALLIICILIYLVSRLGKKGDKREINHIQKATETEPLLINCPVCHNPTSNHASACPKCGQPIKITQHSPVIIHSSKSKSLAVFLALILGGIGAHKFYVDKPGVGFLYLLFCWTFIPAIIGLFEAIQYIMMKDDVFQRKLIEKKL